MLWCLEEHAEMSWIVSLHSALGTVSSLSEM